MYLVYQNVSVHLNLQSSKENSATYRYRCLNKVSRSFLKCSTMDPRLSLSSLDSSTIPPWLKLKFPKTFEIRI